MWDESSWYLSALPTFGIPLACGVQYLGRHLAMSQGDALTVGYLRCKLLSSHKNEGLLERRLATPSTTQSTYITQYGLYTW